MKLLKTMLLLTISTVMMLSMAFAETSKGKVLKGEQLNINNYNINNGSET